MELINHLISDQLLQAIGWTIVHSVWQASFVALMMSIFLNRYHKEKSVVRYRIAVTSLYIILSLSIITFCLHYFTPVDTGHLIVLAINSVDMTTYAGSDLVQNFSIGLVHHFDFITTMWISGMVVFFVKFLGGYLWLKRYERSGKVIPDTKVHIIFNDLIEKMQLNKSVQLMESALVKTPIMIGHLKPIILLPLGIVNHLELNEVEAILAHELSHISRNDFLQNILQSLIEIVYYYHPAVWWISANVRAERENCCDEEAVRLCGSAVNYAKALVKIEELNNQSIPALAIPLARNKHNLFNRVSRILNQPQNKSQIREKLVATVLLFSVFTLFGETNTTFQSDDHFNVSYSLEVDEREDCDLTFMTSNPKSVRKVVIHRDDKKIVIDTIPQKDCKYNDLSIKSISDGNSFSLKINNGVIDELIINGEPVDTTTTHIKIGDEGEIIKTEDGRLLFKEFSKDLGGKEYKDYNLEDIDEDDLLIAPFKISGSKKLQLDKLTEKFGEINLDKDEISRIKDLFENIVENDFSHFHEFEFPTPPQPPMPPTPPSPPKFYKNGDQLKWNFHSDEPMTIIQKQRTPKNNIFRSLLRDGLIEPDEENTLELTDKHLKINGEKMPSNIWKKYKKIYESQLGHELMDGSKIKLKERTKKNSRFFIG